MLFAIKATVCAGRYRESGGFQLVIIWVILVVFALLMLSPVLYGVAVGARALSRSVAARFRRAKAH